MLPTATYQRLALREKEHDGAGLRALTAVQVIEQLVRIWKIGKELSHESGGNARKMTAKCVGLTEVSR